MFISDVFEGILKGRVRVVPLIGCWRRPERYGNTLSSRSSLLGVRGFYLFTQTQPFTFSQQSHVRGKLGDCSLVHSPDRSLGEFLELCPGTSIL